MTELSPIELFAKHTADVDDVTKFVRLIANSGVDAFQQTFPDIEVSSRIYARKMEFWVSEGILQVLTKMEESGHRSQAMGIFKDQQIHYYMNEFVLDTNIQDAIARGLLRGYISAGFVPPEIYEKMYQMKVTD